MGLGPFLDDHEPVDYIWGFPTATPASNGWLGNPDLNWMTGWWARATPLKNMTSSIGMMRFPLLMGKKIHGNHTTNQ